jgi:protein O-GlcNAc transferase
MAAMHLLANLLQSQGRMDEALELLRRLARHQPELPEAHLALALALHNTHLTREALPSIERAIKLRPDWLEAWIKLAAILTELGQTDRAEDAYRKTLALKPDFAEAYANLGINLLTQGRLQEAIRAYREALRIDPHSADTHSNLVYALNFDPGFSAEAIAHEHRRWGERHADPLSRSASDFQNEPDPQRPLRVGYVSPDFRQHSVCYFVEPVLANIDERHFHVFCYSDVDAEDDYTRRLKTYSVTWRDISKLSDDEVFETVRRDSIDILVDLAGHTNRNRLRVFARRAAPLQVTWCGYINTTGLQSIDYRITDAYMDPPGVSEHLYSERLLRLPRIYMAFRPPLDCPAVNALPALTNGHVTFGCFNGRFKTSDADIRMWAEILRRFPGSRLLLAPISEGRTRTELAAAFSSNGVEVQRLEFLSPMPYHEYLTAHQRIDMLLDTSTVHGVTTTVHSLWMGVPTVVLAGDRCVSRAGVSVLTNVGLSEWVARNESEYVQIASRWGSDLEGLARLRQSLRGCMANAPNCDERGVTRELEHAYRQIWQAWCKAEGKS